MIQIENQSLSEIHLENILIFNYNKISVSYSHQFQSMQYTVHCTISNGPLRYQIRSAHVFGVSNYLNHILYMIVYYSTITVLQFINFVENFFRHLLAFQIIRLVNYSGETKTCVITELML